jgi:hypothetical protein
MEPTIEVDDFNNPVVRPIRRSRRLMHIQMRMTKTGKYSNEFKVIPKATSSTIKKRNVSCDETGKIVYGSYHHSGCAGCCERPKMFGKKKTEFKRYAVKKEIDDHYISMDEDSE